MRAQIVTATILLLIGPFAMAANPISWGKAGVSYDQYRTDAQACTMAALNAELTQKPPPFWDTGSADTLDAFLRQNDGANTALVRIQTDSAILAIQTCLRRKGYQRFRLTDAQRDQLKTLATGTEERHQYLYGLSQDTAILAAQSVQDDEK